MGMSSGGGHLGLAAIGQLECVWVVAQPSYIKTTKTLSDVDHARLFAGALTVLVLAFVHFQDHHVRVQIEQEVGPLAAAQGGVERDLVVTGGHQAVHVQEILDDFLFALGVLEVNAGLTVAADVTMIEDRHQLTPGARPLHQVEVRLQAMILAALSGLLAI